MRIVDIVHDRFGGDAANAVDRLNTLDLFVSLGDLVQLFFDGLEVAFKCVQLDQLQVKFASPQFLHAALRQRLAVVDQELPACVPSFRAGTDLDTLV